MPHIRVSDGVQPLPDHRLRVGDDGHRSLVVLADGLAIQQHVNDVTRQLQLHARRRTVWHDRTQDHHGVAGGQPFLDRVLTPDAAAQHRPKGQRVALRESPLCAVGSDNRSAQHLGQAHDLLGPAEHLHFLTDHNCRTPRLQQRLKAHFHHRWVALRNACIPGPEDLHVGLVAEQVRGQLELDWPGPTVLETLKGLHQVVGDGLNLADHGVPVGNRLEHAKLVLGLVGGIAPLADEVALHVGGHLQQRRPGKIGLSHRPHRVGGAGAGAGDQDPGLPGGAGVTVGHEAASQLQPTADEAQAVLLIVQCVEQLQVVNADYPEDCVDSLGLQGLGDGLAAGQVGHFITPRLRYFALSCSFPALELPLWAASYSEFGGNQAAILGIGSQGEGLQS